MLMDIYSLFPLLLPQNKAKTVYKGFIEIYEHEFLIKLVLKDPNHVCGASIYVEPRVQQLLLEHGEFLQQRLEKAIDLKTFLVELKTLLEKLVRESNAFKIVQTSFLRNILAELEAVGWNRVVFIDDLMLEFHFASQDKGRRKHLLKVKVSSQYPAEPPTCCCELPAIFDPAWRQTSKLVDLVTQFDDSLGEYQEFWDEMDSVDEHCIVLEPESPSRAATMRRIVVDTNVSVRVFFNAQNVKQLPEIHFLGSENAVANLRDTWQLNCCRWQTMSSVVDNLSTVLDVSFPSPQSQEKEMLAAACGICFAHALDGCYPEEVCANSKCCQAFHHSCLYEWLRTQPSRRQSFNMIFGQCPYCKLVGVCDVFGLNAR